ncbi:MAG TPA: mandelate racemase/muconate lactonizing enzyme family protein [Bryobacteraceae bacterium]|nr:mandelate racemase/muconate lactonizing enzyme family protein [Bryobacteraceae bacterium]
MSLTLTRRDLLRALVAAPAVASFPRLAAAAEPHRGKVKITQVRAMQIRDIAGNCLIKVDTDAGLAGYGEAGVSGPMARARIAQFRQHLAGQDPLAIERHFHNLITLMHPYMANIPTISGIDMALWDLAGKITGQPVNVLLGGPFRDAIRMYSHGIGIRMLDPASCRDWAARIKAAPEAFTAFKIGIDPLLGVPSARYAVTLDSTQLRNVARGFSNVREAVGDGIDIAVHCHNELDTPSAIQVARVVEPMNPLFFEDPLHVPFSEGWMALRRSTRIPLLTGEKLELVQGFRPFLDHQAADIIHPDLAFAGGFTGAKKIADYAMLTRTPVALHNVGSLVLCYASAHFGSAIHNFYRSESALGRPARHVEQMSATKPPQVANGHLKVPEGPGLGFEPNNEYLRSVLMPDEPFWS